MWNDKFVNELELPMGALLQSMTDVKQRVDGLWSWQQQPARTNEHEYLMLWALIKK